MIELKIEDFIPYYPSKLNLIQNKEFLDERVPASEEPSRTEKTLLKQQKIISRFLSSNTPYDRILLDHEMGCLAGDTPVLLYGGIKKKAEDVLATDILVGEDGSPRYIQCLKRGLDKMYEIHCFETGFSDFVVNEQHILTVFSVSTKTIYDIHIQDYMILPVSERSNLRCFRRHHVIPDEEVNNKNKNLHLNVPESFRAIPLTSIELSPFTVNFVGVDHYYGWTLHGIPRFLLGDGTVTHNSGKTCSAIASIERILKEKRGINKGIILAPGDTILASIIQDTVTVCSDRFYIKGLEGMSAPRKRAIMKSTLKKSGYAFYTFHKFGKLIKKFKRKINDGTDVDKYRNVIEKFGNSVFVLDEVHRIRPKEGAKPEDIESYREIKEFFIVLDSLRVNHKIILMSGTPMRDSPEEIATVMNLILPKTGQMLEGEQFLQRYMIKNEDQTYSISSQAMTDELKTYFRGRVSFLAGMKSDIPKIYQSNTGANQVGSLSYFKVWVSVMSDFQSKGYLDTLSNGTRDFETNSRQASMMMFPKDENMEEPRFDRNVFKDNVDIKEQKSLSLTNSSNKKKGTVKVFSFKGTMKKVYDSIKIQKTDSAKLAIVKKYSSKYAFIIERILRCAEEGKCMFCYSQYVEKSGLVVLSLLLEAFGYTKATGRERVDSRRYALLTTKSATPQDIDLIKNRFNQQDNMRGGKIQVIFASDVASTGLSFYHIQEEHIISPFWNYTNVSQAEFRGYRVGSHRYLHDAGIQVQLNVYLHVSVPSKAEVQKYNKTSTFNNHSIELHMYETSEKKDVSIKRIERPMKEVSFDCPFTYERNTNDAFIEGSRECEYTNCKYRCTDMGDIEPPYDLGEEHKVVNNYLAIYQEDYMKKVVELVKRFFRKRFRAGFDEIFNWVRYTVQTESLKINVQYYDVLEALNRLIKYNVEIVNAYLMKNYLYEVSNIYYLSNQINNSNLNSPEMTSMLSSFYTEHPILVASEEETRGIKVNDTIYLRSLFLSEDETTRDRILDGMNTKVVYAIFEFCVKYTLDMDIRNSLTPNGQRAMVSLFQYFIKNRFKSFVKSQGHTMLFNPEKSIYRCFDTSTKTWSDCPESFRQNKEKSIEQSIARLSSIEHNPMEYWAKDTNDNPDDVFSFRIIKREATKKRKADGMKCGSFKNHVIFDIIYKLEMPFLDDAFEKFSDEELKVDIKELMSSSMFREFRDTFKDSYTEILENLKDGVKNGMKRNIVVKRLLYFNSLKFGGGVRSKADTCKMIKKRMLDLGLILVEG